MSAFASRKTPCNGTPREVPKMVSDALSIVRINWHAMAAKADGTSAYKGKNIWREKLRKRSSEIGHQLSRKGTGRALLAEGGLNERIL
jgi:hypothetical protein